MLFLIIFSDLCFVFVDTRYNRYSKLPNKDEFHEILDKIASNDNNNDNNNTFWCLGLMDSNEQTNYIYEYLSNICFKNKIMKNNDNICAFDLGYSKFSFICKYYDVKNILNKLNVCVGLSTLDNNICGDTKLWYKRSQIALKLSKQDQNNSFVWNTNTR